MQWLKFILLSLRRRLTWDYTIPAVYSRPKVSSNFIVCNTAQTLLWSLEFVIHQNLQHSTIAVIISRAAFSISCVLHSFVLKPSDSSYNKEKLSNNYLENVCIFIVRVFTLSRNTIFDTTLRKWDRDSYCHLFRRSRCSCIMHQCI